jgi:hypothetical protein
MVRVLKVVVVVRVVVQIQIFPVQDKVVVQQE